MITHSRGNYVFLKINPDFDKRPDYFSPPRGKPTFFKVDFLLVQKLSTENENVVKWVRKEGK